MRTMQQDMAAVIRANWVEINKSQEIRVGKPSGELAVIHVRRRGELQTIQSNHGKVAVIRDR